MPARPLGPGTFVLTLLFLLLAVASPRVAARDSEQEPSQARAEGAQKSIETILVEIAEGKRDLAKLRVEYSDIHQLWGGLQLAINGNGTVEQKAVQIKSGVPRRVSPDEIRKLARLLVDEKAWQQRTARATHALTKAAPN